ncbi:putative mitochondrial protein [Tanacetum coccineum]
MVNIRNNSLEVPTDAGVRQWVTDHVDSVSVGINEKLDTITTSVQHLLLLLKYIVNDVDILKGGEGSSRFSRMSKLEFSKFYGEDVQFVKTHGETVAWNEFEKAIMKRFGPVNEDPMAELKNLRHDTSMKEYQSQFEKLLNLVDINESQSISMFIDGLPGIIELNVRMFKPKSLSDAFSLASLQEATLVVIKQRNTPLLLTPKTASGWNANMNVSYPSKSTTTTLALPASNTQTVHQSLHLLCMFLDSNLHQLLKEYANVFIMPKALIPHRIFDHNIPLKEDNISINKRPYRYPPTHKDTIEAMIKELLDSRLIRPSSNPFSSSIVMVKKKDGS